MTKIKDNTEKQRRWKKLSKVLLLSNDYVRGRWILCIDLVAHS